MKSNNPGRSFSIFSNLKRVINEVGEDRVLALIAHHEPDQFYKTIKVSFFNKDIRLCTRCTGIYSGIITTILYLFFSLTIPEIFMSGIIYAFPIPAMLDWGLGKYGVYRGNNTTRFVSGFMLGICYVFLWTKFIQNPLDIEIWSIAVVCVFIAYFVLKYSSRRAAYRE
jgi:uncharacterized membrane protein